MLHIISNNNIISLNYCQHCLHDDDCILFIEDGIYLTIQNKSMQPLQNINYYALEADVEARGIKQLLPHYIHLINYDKFVELTEIYPTTQTW